MDTGLKMSSQSNEPAVSVQEDIWQPTSQQAIPFELNQDAYHGLAGQFAEEAVRESEASPVAVLLTCNMRANGKSPKRHKCKACRTLI